MKRKLLLLSAVVLGMSGCASVPTVNTVESTQVKEFKLPEDGNAGIYIFRKDALVGVGLKKYVYVDGECIGETAPGVFYYHEVQGGEEHTISTESEFSENHLTLTTEKGQNYFVQQYIKPGVFVGGADLKQVSEKKGKKEVGKINMAVKQTCASLEQTEQSTAEKP